MHTLKNLVLVLSVTVLCQCGSAGDDRSFAGGSSSAAIDSNASSASVQATASNSANSSSSTDSSSTDSSSTDTTSNTDIDTPNPVADPDSPTTNTPQSAPQPSSSPSGITVSSARISSFIWKPESERDGNLVILVNPIRVTVEVTGDISERLVDSGPSNGKGTTARARHTGCAFGNGAIVEFFDSRGLPIRTNNGLLKLNIPNGCDRFEF